MKHHWDDTAPPPHSERSERRTAPRGDVSQPQRYTAGGTPTAPHQAQSPRAPQQSSRASDPIPQRYAASEAQREPREYPRSEMTGARPPARQPYAVGGGMPMPPRRAVPPTQHEQFQAPPLVSHVEHDADESKRILRRVDGSPIPTRSRPRRSRPIEQSPENPAPASTQTWGQQGLQITPTAYAAPLSPFNDIILEMPAAPTETRAPRFTPPMPLRGPALPPAPLPQRYNAPSVRREPQSAVPAMRPLSPSTAHEQTSTSMTRKRDAEAVVNRPAAQLAEPEPMQLPEGICAKCYGAGYLRLDVPVGHPSFGRAVPCVCKEEERAQRRRAELWKLSSLDAFKEMTFDRFNADVQGTREASEVTKRYAANPEGWLVLSGSCGSGKTHLAAAIANIQLDQGMLVLFSVVPHLLDHLRSAFAPNSESTYDELFERVCQANLLVLDDLGSEHSTPWAQEKLFQIINHRYMYRYPTVITTNLELINDIDDRVRSRLTDIGLVRHVRLEAGDYRPHHVPQRRVGRSLR